MNWVIESHFGRAVIAILSYVLAIKNRNIDNDKVRKLLGYVSNIEDPSESFIKSLLQQIKLSEQKLASSNRGFSSFSLNRRSRLLQHFFYSMVLRSLNRSIIKLRYGERDDYVPNLGAVLFSPIDKCNLKCKGCVTGSDRKGADTPDLKDLNYAMEQAKRLNTYHIIITGKGEPFCDRDSKDKLLALAKRHVDLNFIIYTNGTTLKEEDVKKISKLTNVYLILSVDGLGKINDSRRGEGVYKRVTDLMGILNKYNMIFGYCSTVCSGNYRHVTSLNFVNTMADLGCKFGVYLKFVPIAKDIPSDLILNENEKAEYERLFVEALSQSPIVLTEPDMAEQKYGCRARQGTMIHIDGVTGKISPCVKTPFSPQECNIYNNPHKDRLLEILRSNFFACYRRGFAPGKCCSSRFCDEIDEFLSVPGMSEEEIEKLSWVKENLEKA